MTSRIRARGVTREFGGGVGVREIDLDVEAGEIHALVGLNGAGKSTLMRLLLGMLRPDRGSITINGRDLLHARWARVGHLVENPLAYGELDARTNLLIAAQLHGVARQASAAMVDGILAELGVAKFANIKVRRLSTGTRQRTDSESK